MKLIALLALIPFFSAQAVVVKTCPEKVTVSLPKIFNNDVIDEEAFGDDSSFPFDGWNGPGIFRLLQKLAKLGSLTLDLDLIRTSNSQCSYSGVDLLVATLVNLKELVFQRSPSNRRSSFMKRIRAALIISAIFQLPIT